MTTKTVGDAAQQLEATMLRQMLREAKIFGSSESPGSHVYADMFVDVVANAISKGGGLGVAKTLERSLDPAHAEVPHPQGLHALHAESSVPSGAGLEEALLVSRGARVHVTSGFGARTDPINGHADFHSGVDVAAPRGTPIRALGPGTVTFAGERGGYGLVVEIEHAGGLTTRYAHAERLHVVAGQHVASGDLVADVGSTGRSTGPHVHVEARIQGRPVDPKIALQVFDGRADGRPEDQSP